MKKNIMIDYDKKILLLLSSSYITPMHKESVLVQTKSEILMKG